MTEAKQDIFAALSAVMGDVQNVGKKSRNADQGFNFRGIDAVMNAVGPALREHGVVITPSAVEIVETRYYDTDRGTSMENVKVAVTYSVLYGLDGSVFSGAALGEASDAGDKAIPKAMSVAFRTFLLQLLCLPTDEPDPDASSHTRGALPAATAAAHDAYRSVPDVPAPPKEVQDAYDALKAIALASKKPESDSATTIQNVAAWKATYGQVLDAMVKHGSSMQTLEKIADSVASGALA